MKIDIFEITEKLEDMGFAVQCLGQLNMGSKGSNSQDQTYRVIFKDKLYHFSDGDNTVQVWKTLTPLLNYKKAYDHFPQFMDCINLVQKDVYLSDTVLSALGKIFKQYDLEVSLFSSHIRDRLISNVLEDCALEVLGCLT